MSSRRSPSKRPLANDASAVWAWVGVVGLAASGLGLSAYLLEEHYVAWTDPSVKALCDINEALSCSEVARSPYAVFLGLPVAGWGVLGYLTIAAVGFWGWFARKRGAAAVAALGVLAGFSALTSVGLGVLSKLAIGVLCPFCMGTYGVNGALAVLAVALFVKTGWREAWSDAAQLAKAQQARCVQLGVGSALAVALIAWGYPKYWRNVDPIAEQLRTMPPPPPSASACSGSVQGTGVTPDGHPWIGAVNPKVTITEFSDYQCPFCALAHRKLRALVEAYPAVLRVVHRHFPLDQACNPIIQQPFHPSSCYYAGMAVCAGEQGKFWAANDHLFLHAREPQPIEIAPFAAEIGLDKKQLEQCLAERAWNALRPDLEEGIRLNLRGTPTFLVNGELRMGSDPAEILAPYLPDSGKLRATPTTPEPGASLSGEVVASSHGSAATPATKDSAAPPSSPRPSPPSPAPSGSGAER